MAGTVKARYKALERDRLREYINGQKCLKNIDNCLLILTRDYLKLGPEESMAIKAAMDGNFKLLNKVLPDLKAVEHSGQLAVDTAIKITVSG
jgi:hypothetical protein